MQLFDTTRKEKPNELKKVTPICGDITLHQLGISESDQALLCRNVSVVFHSAATVKFDEKLELSVKINMLGTKRLVELCHRMKNLDVSDGHQALFMSPLQLLLVPSKTFANSTFCFIRRH